MVEGSTEIRDFDTEPVRPTERSSEDIIDGCLDHGHQVVVEPIDNINSGSLPVEPLLGIAPNCLEVPVAVEALDVDRDEQRLAHQCLNQVDHIGTRHIFEDRASTIEPETAGENRELFERAFFVVSEESI